MTEATPKEPLDQLKNEAQHAEVVVAAQAQAGAAPTVVPRPIRRYRALLFQGYVIAAAIAFGVLFFFARTVPYFTFDLPVARWVQSFNPPWFDALMRFITGLGFTPLAEILCGLIILFVFVIGLRWEAVALTFAGVGVGALGGLVKVIVQRPRPTASLVNVYALLSDPSFPSGHVLLFTAFLGFLFFMLYTLVPHSTRRTLGLVLFGALIALVGVSRVYLGEHWPSDVLGAYLLGSLWLALTIYLYGWGKPRFFVNQPLAPDAGTKSNAAPTDRAPH
ncbi:MAG: phosphatase PAP2 family protein [Anaerolineae bacterium]